MKRQYIIDNLDRALKEKWIKVYYQPVVRNANGRVCAEESYARWVDANDILLTAQQFVPILEEANRTYELDLWVVDSVLEKMKEQAYSGLYVVPQSVNLSYADFCNGDIIEEIKNRVDNANIPREKLVIEISESTIAKDKKRITKVVERFKQLGFTVWMDDFGGGYSSPLFLQEIPFDLVKLDKSIIKKIDDKKTKIIVTELVRMAMALDMDTIAEGVEKKTQVDFLKDIGCTMLQGNYFCKPISLSGIIERNIKGIQIGFENPAEADYYDKLGRVNFYELTVQREKDASLDNYFDTWPMTMVECKGDKVSLIRCNGSYKEFAKRNLSEDFLKMEYCVSDYNGRQGNYTLKAIQQCAEDGKRLIFDDRTKRGLTVQLLVWRIAINPCTGVAALMVVVLSAFDGITDRMGLTYNYIARALSEDYIQLYFVDLDTGEYTEYSADGANRDVSEERRGQNFFDEAYKNAKQFLYDDDRDDFFKVFNKDNIEKSLKQNGSFTHTYRCMIDGKPVFVSMKIIKVRNGKNHIIIGVNSVDAQMKQKEALERVKEERRAFYRIAALAGDFMAIYAINPETDAFTQYSTTDLFDTVGALAEGADFYTASRKNAQQVVYGPDKKYFFEHFKKELILEEVRKHGLFSMSYRLLIQNMPVYVCLKAALIHEKGEDRIVVGIINIQKDVERKREYEQALSEVTMEATIDELTGVKRKLPYLELEEELNERIAAGEDIQFAVCVFDINGLKEVNDTLGHQAGDRYIIDGCKMVCHVFKQSPVFRLGGDEFAVVAQDNDYQKIDELMDAIAKVNSLHKQNGQVVVAAGMSRFEKDASVAEVFKRADENMYRNKQLLKQTHKGV